MPQKKSTPDFSLAWIVCFTAADVCIFFRGNFQLLLPGLLCRFFSGLSSFSLLTALTSELPLT
jgi:hypothetical protein